MAVKILHINSNDIQSEQYKRFDAKYYVVNDFFNSLVTTQKVKVATLDELKEKIICKEKNEKR